MKKNYFYLMMALAMAGRAIGQTQPCFTDEMHKANIAAHPDLLLREADYEKQIQEGLKKIDFKKAAAKVTTDESGNPGFWYDIPIVIHVVHDYNAYSTSAGDYIPDTAIYNAVKAWNIVYAKQNSDTADVIAPFKKYIGNPHIRLHLATIDPYGNRTNGITRKRSYMTYSGGEMAKYDDWAPTSYVNIWFINKMSTANNNAAAYAHLPADVTYIPQYDGVISLAGYMNNGSKTINHELGHVFNLIHVWGGTNNPDVSCGDDNVDDTPPTKGHNPQGCTAFALWDTTCSTNYYKIYADAVTGVMNMVDYPDTNNSQNIMDYTYCDKMFTIGQCDRMHATLNNSVAGRDNLWTPSNLEATGALLPMPDLPPVPDFSVTNVISTSYYNKNANFAFPGTAVKFINQTMGDTLTDLQWTFSNGASTPTSNSLTNFTNTFSEPGWVNITLKATGNGTGTVTTNFNNSVFVADVNATDGNGYMQDFSPSGDRDKWVSFNYYNNEFKWQHADVGMYDNSSIMYTGYDARLQPLLNLEPTTGTPLGDFDDLYSVPVNLSGFTDACNLNFYYSAASRTSLGSDVNDTLSIEYSANKSAGWVTLATLTKGSLINKGAVMQYYIPSGPADWSAKTIPVPAAARTPYTTFRFRYRPGANATTLKSTGNNFYMDRISFSRYAAEASNIKMGNIDVAIVPNPTQGDALVIIKDVNNTTAQINVTDITGKVVFTTSQAVTGSEIAVKIPHDVISVPGMYLVQTITGNQVNTQKLVVTK